MLGANFKLTPAQTEMLCIMAFGHYTNSGDGPVLPNWRSPYFVSTGQSLIQKGLASHDPDRTPTWQATDAGVAMANLIVVAAERLVALKKKEVANAD